MNQRAVRDGLKLLESTFKKVVKILRNTEIEVREIIEKTDAVISEYSDSSKVNVEKRKAEEMQQKCIETFSETKTRLDGESKKLKGHVEVDLKPGPF